MRRRNSAVAAERPIELAVVMPSVGRGGGAERVVVNLLNHLASTRIRSDFVVFQDGRQADELTGDAVVVHDLARPKLRQAIAPLFGWLRRRRPDIVFASLHNVNLGVLALKPFLPSTMRFVVRESSLPSRSLPNLRHGRCLAVGYRLLYRTADLVICPTMASQDELVRHFGVSADRTVVLPNPVSVDQLRAAATPPRRAAGDGARFVAVGRLFEAKGYDLLLDMFARLSPTSHLTIVGDGPDEADLRRQAVQLGLGGRLHLAGRMANPWPLMAGADAFVMPSRWEGMPNAALEALACGTPVIASTNTGLSDVVEKAPADAITIAEIGAEFGQRMAAVPVRASSTVRPSLLPPDFAVDRVAAAYAGLFEQMISARQN